MQRAARVLYPVAAGIPLVMGLLHSYRGPRAYPFGSQNSLQAYVALGVLSVFVGHIAGIPDEVEDVQPALVRSVFASFLSTSIWVVFQTISPGLLPRWVIFTSAAVGAFWAFLCSWSSVLGRRQQMQRERTIAVLAASEIDEFLAEVNRSFPLPEIASTVSSVLNLDDGYSNEVNRPEPGQRQNQVGTLEQFIRADAPNLVVLSDAASRSAAVVDAVSRLHREGVKVRTLGTFYDEYLGKVSLGELTRMSVLFDVRNLHHPTYRRVKRIIDSVGGCLAGVVCLVCVLPILVANLMGNRGPLIFRQKRIGLHGEEFSIFKFRTMAPTEQEVGLWTTPDDPRVTRFGRVLRRMHVDELPQFWNILRGDLSLVGPRPEQPKYVHELSAKESAYELRHLVLPGLTGWAQIKLRYADTEGAAIEKLQYDLYYLQHQSLALDLRILSRTIRSVLRRRGR